MPVVTEYCTLDDLEDLGMGARAFAKTSAPAREAAIETASSQIDSYLRNQYTLPLQRHGADLRRCCAVLACYVLLSVKGFDPAADGNEVIVEERDRQLRWLENIAKGNAAPDVTDSSSEGRAFGTGPRVITSTSRGYGNRTGNRGAFTRD